MKDMSAQHGVDDNSIRYYAFAYINKLIDIWEGVIPSTAVSASEVAFVAATHVWHLAVSGMIKAHVSEDQMHRLIDEYGDTTVADSLTAKRLQEQRRHANGLRSRPLENNTVSETAKEAVVHMVQYSKNKTSQTPCVNWAQNARVL